jgi:hypothetical protein
MMKHIHVVTDPKKNENKNEEKTPATMLKSLKSAKYQNHRHRV